MNRFAEPFYREYAQTGRWKAFRVKIETSDLYIRADNDCAELAHAVLTELRAEIRDHIKRQDTFLPSLKPVKRLPGVPLIIDRMYEAGERAGTGPMAAVAGAIAECVGSSLMECSREVIVENGGDNWLSLKNPAAVSIYAGRSPFSGRVGILLGPEETPCGICTSSGRVGHSISFGKADAVTIVAADAALADAVATQTCNMVQTEDDLNDALDFALSVEGIKGAVIIYRDKLAVRGSVKLVDPETLQC